MTKYELGQDIGTNFLKICGSRVEPVRGRHGYPRLATEAVFLLVPEENRSSNHIS